MWKKFNVAAEMLKSMFVPAGIHFAVVEDDFVLMMLVKRKFISIWMKRQQLIEINFYYRPDTKT